MLSCASGWERDCCGAGPGGSGIVVAPATVIPLRRVGGARRSHSHATGRWPNAVPRGRLRRGCRGTRCRHLARQGRPGRLTDPVAPPMPCVPTETSRGRRAMTRQCRQSRTPRSSRRHGRPLCARLAVAADERGGCERQSGCRSWKGSVTSDGTRRNRATRLTKTARETLSVPHVGMPAKR